MYIQPNSEVRLLSGVPLDKSYINTIWWNTKQEQFDYFVSKSEHVFTDYSYQRYNESVISVSGVADNYYNINYMMFQNTSYSNKWFYAFVVDVEYSNDNATNIYYKIDVMQTWFFDYNLNPVMIEREHSVLDNIGDNIQIEGLELGDYKIYNNEYVIAPFYNAGSGQGASLGNTKWTVMATNLPPDVEIPINRIVNGIYTGVYVFEHLGKSEVDELLERYTRAGTQDSIFAICQAPTLADGNVHNFRSTLANFNTIDGYKPKNNKLFTYPYHVLNFVSSDGSATTLKYEYFSNGITFNIMGIVNPMPEVLCYPTNYNGDNSNLLEVLFVKNLPTCSALSDSFAAWFAQNRNSIAATLSNTVESNNLIRSQSNRKSLLSGSEQLVEGALGTMAQLKKGKIDAAINSAVGTGFNIAKTAQDWEFTRENTNLEISNAYKSAIATQKDRMSVPNGIIGSASSAGSIYNLNACGFRLYHTSIRYEYAKIIDDYFSRYGYATNVIKIPNRNSRPHWNYIKTIGCTIIGNLPCTHEEAIQNIYDNGITFWKNPAEVGNYNLDNSPV